VIEQCRRNGTVGSIVECSRLPSHARRYLIENEVWTERFYHPESNGKSQTKQSPEIWTLKAALPL
jgi:hypothetical protein